MKEGPLKTIRLEKRMSQKAIAEAVGVSAEMIRQYENGVSSPRADKIPSLAEALGLSQENLISILGGDDVGVRAQTSTPARLAPTAVALPDEEIYDLIVIDEAKVRASCGDLVVFDHVGDDDMYRRQMGLSFFASLIGFHPPPGLHAMRTEGRSMEPGVPLDQWVLFLPAEHTRYRQIINGRRYIFQTEDENTGDFAMSLKRLQIFSDGSVKIISDNPAAGVEDEILIPAKRVKDEGGPGWLVQQRTGGRVRLHVMGEVLWPRDGEDSRETRTLSRMIETMAHMGYIKRAD